MQKPQKARSSKRGRAPRKAVQITPEYSLLIQPWRALTDTQKMKAVIRHAKLKGGRAVTLNLSPAFEGHLHNITNPMRAVGQRMNLEFNKMGMHDLPVLLMLEISPDGRLHLHGVYISGDHASDAIQTAMRNAVGYVTGRAGSRQFMGKSITDPDGWHRYITADERNTRRRLAISNDTRLHWISRPLTRLTRDHHDERRRSMPVNLNCAPPARAG